MKEEVDSLFPIRSDFDSVGNACQTSFGNEGINNFGLDGPGVSDDSRFPGPHHAALAACGPGEPACPLLDTYLPQSEYKKERKIDSFAWLRSRMQRRLRSRTYWGLQLPGRYYFWTFTNSGFSQKQKSNWRKLKWWLKRYRPGIAGIYCMTQEVNGVIHLVVRLKRRQKRIIKEEIQEYWNSLGGGYTFVATVSDSDKTGLANYLSDQRRKNGMAKEMGCQTLITSWNRFGTWLPVHWTKDFGRAWVRTNGMPLASRILLFKSWLLRYVDDPDTWKPRTPLTWDIEEGWIEMLPDEFTLDSRFVY